MSAFGALFLNNAETTKPFLARQYTPTNILMAHEAARAEILLYAGSMDGTAYQKAQLTVYVSAGALLRLMSLLFRYRAGSLLDFLGSWKTTGAEQERITLGGHRLARAVNMYTAPSGSTLLIDRNIINWHIDDERCSAGLAETRLCVGKIPPWGLLATASEEKVAAPHLAQWLVPCGVTNSTYGTFSTTPTGSNRRWNLPVDSLCSRCHTIFISTPVKGGERVAEKVIFRNAV